MPPPNRPPPIPPGRTSRACANSKAFKRVVAPFDGIVTARNTDVGYLINAGEAANAELFRLADVHKLRIYAQVPEAYAEATKTGIKAELHFEEHPDQGFPAQTVRTSNALDSVGAYARGRTAARQLRTAVSFPAAYTEVHFKLPSRRKR